MTYVANFEKKCSRLLEVTPRGLPPKTKFLVLMSLIQFLILKFKNCICGSKVINFLSIGGAPRVISGPTWPVLEVAIYHFKQTSYLNIFIKISVKTYKKMSKKSRKQIEPVNFRKFVPTKSSLNFPK